MDFVIFAGIVIAVVLISTMSKTSGDRSARIVELEEEVQELRDRVDELESELATKDAGSDDWSDDDWDAEDEPP